MGNQRIAVCDLAHELGVSSRELIQAAQSLGINVIRAVATLSPGQAHVLREAVANNLVTQQIRAERAAAAQAVREEARAAEETARQRYDTCTCCGYLFAYFPTKESGEICRDCRHHFERPGESYVETLTRHEEHVAQSKRKVEDYREACHKLSTERDEAYRKRDKWMRALVEIVVAHGPAEDNDGCACGSPEFPCVTRRHLRFVNRGIYNRCEELEAMNEAEFNRVLYGTDYSYFIEWDDGVA
ncbi:hypothetical protein [Aestuariimicrobium sp. Y1814]|uniref:hypothetical protein n=1 Tax=Aestuariimicrobium sp. Y1814 TaxID=3418742 RepID=UPI003DA6D002